MRIMSILLIIMLSLSLCACGENVENSIVEKEVYEENVLEVSGVIESMMMYNNGVDLKIRTSDNELLIFTMSANTHVYDETGTNKDVYLSDGCYVKIEYLEKYQNYNKIKIEKITVTSYDGSVVV